MGEPSVLARGPGAQACYWHRLPKHDWHPEDNSTCIRPGSGLMPIIISSLQRESRNSCAVKPSCSARWQGWELTPSSSLSCLYVKKIIQLISSFKLRLLAASTKPLGRLGISFKCKGFATILLFLKPPQLINICLRETLASALSLFCWMLTLSWKIKQVRHTWLGRTQRKMWMSYLEGNLYFVNV